MGKEQEAMYQAATIFTENCISNGISVFYGCILPNDFDIYLMSTEQLPHFGGARKSSAEMQAGAKGCTESCGDSAPV
ncbi:hypothetical protein ACTNEV_04775, partial [Oscillospiraceae bacterium HCP3S3_D12]